MKRYMNFVVPVLHGVERLSDAGRFPIRFALKYPRFASPTLQVAAVAMPVIWRLLRPLTHFPKLKHFLA